MHLQQWLVVTLLAGACGGKEPPPPEPLPANKVEAEPPIESAEDPAMKAQVAAELEAQRAIKDADDAEANVERLYAELVDLDKRVGLAVDAVVSSQSDADRASAKAKLAGLQQEKAALEQRVAEAKAAAARAERQKGVKISKECLDNPLAKGC